MSIRVLRDEGVLYRAGGLAVVAHPARYKFSANEEYALFTEFKKHGGVGVEVVTGSHSSAEAARYADIAVEFGLLVQLDRQHQAIGHALGTDVAAADVGDVLRLQPGPRL